MLTTLEKLNCFQMSLNVYDGFWGTPSLINGSETLYKYQVGKGTIEYSTLVNDNSTYICFQGTRDLKDWYWNFDFELVNFNQHFMKTHRGYLLQFNLILDQINKRIKELNQNRIIFTGHSLGGALCTLFALHYAIKNFASDSSKKIECLPLASPYCGDIAFAEAFNKLIPDTTRFVNGSDLVPQLPRSYEGLKYLDEHLPDMIKKYKHIGQRIQLGREKKYFSCSLMDHHPSLYLKNFKKEWVRI